MTEACSFSPPQSRPQKSTRKRRPDLTPRLGAFPAVGPASTMVDELERERAEGSVHRGEL